MWQLTCWDCHPSSLLMCCISCTLSGHGTHDPLLGILEQFLLLVIGTFQYQVQLLVPAGLFAHAIPYMILMYHFWHFYACHFYPWCPRVIGWVSTQPCFFYPLDVFQGSSSWGRLSLSLINYLLCLTLRVQLLYSLVENWLVQFQCTAMIGHCFFFFHCPVLGGVLNLALSTVRTFWFCSNKSLDTLVCIHCLLQNNTVSLVIRISVGVVLRKPLCFLAYGFLTLSLFHV